MSSDSGSPSGTSSGDTSGSSGSSGDKSDDSLVLEHLRRNPSDRFFHTNPEALIERLRRIVIDDSVDDSTHVSEDDLAFDRYLSEQFQLQPGPGQRLYYHPKYPRISFKNLSFDHPGIKKALAVFLSFPQATIIRPSSFIFGGVDILKVLRSKGFFPEKNFRKSFSERMLPFMGIELLCAFTEDFAVCPLWTRPVKLTIGDIVHKLATYTVSFQVGRKSFYEIQLKKCHGLWLLHTQDDGPAHTTALELKTSPTALNEKTVLVYISNIIEQRTIARGTSPPIWLNNANVAPAIDEEMVLVSAKAYSASSADVSAVMRRLIPDGNNEPVMSITYVGSLIQFLKCARMFTIPDRPNDLNPRADYNVTDMYQEVYTVAFLDNSIYQSSQSFEQKYTTFLDHKGKSILMCEGGPGTGKTSTSAKVIVSTAFKRISEKKQRTKHLVVTPSNAAADVIFHKLVDEKNNCSKQYPGIEFKVCRVGNKTKFSESVRRVAVTSEAAFIQDYRDKEGGGGALSASEEDIISGYLLSTDIIVVTFGSSQCRELTDIRHRARFDVLIMDECGQANFHEFMLPLFNCFIWKMFFIGDPRQLGPILKWSGFNDFPLRDTSVFVRIYQKIVDHGENALISLRKQHRMRRFVAETVSKISYDDKSGGRLETVTGNWQSTLNLPEFVVISGKTWFDKPSPYSFSHQNDDEFLCGMLFIQASMIQAGFNWEKKQWPPGVTPLSYAIIPLYRGQLLLFTREISSIGLDRFVVVNTVDDMQGSEVDVAIVSAVRASPEHDGVGFACDQRRLNVAISRAACVYILAKMDDFVTQPGWNILFNIAALNGRLVTNAEKYKRADQALSLLRSFQSRPIYKGE